MFMHEVLLSGLYKKISMLGSGFLDGIDNGVCGDESFDILNILDFSMESLEGDGLVGEDWHAEFESIGPIPSEVLPSSYHVYQGDNGNDTLDMQPMLSIRSDGTPKLNQLPKFVEETSSTNIPLQNGSSDGKESDVFQAPSPISVLESSSSCSGEKRMSITLDKVIPVGPRSKRPRALTSNPWFVMSPISSAASASKKLKREVREKKLSLLSGAINMEQNSFQTAKKKLQHVSGAMETNTISLQQYAIKKCTHCEVTETPQWREGPMGPKSLCNACGVRYRSGRLFPEYRPAASPTFVPSLHSNSHRKVMAMRNKGNQNAAMAEIDSALFPPLPELVPMSSHLYDLLFA